VLFGPPLRRIWLWILCGALIAVAVVLGETRGIWIAVAVAGLYLCWFWKRWLVMVAPLVLLAGIAVAPAALRDRFTSIFKPDQGGAPNQSRVFPWRRGMEMTKRNPFLALGPGGVKTPFDKCAPADIPRPLPSGWYGHLHNIYLHYAAERGIPALVI